MERIYQKIGRIREYRSQVQAMEADCIRLFSTDAIYRGALLHYLYLLADSCVALAELVIKHKGFRLPQSYHEAFDVLGENRIIDPAFAQDFAKIAGFRNFLAHDYEQVDAPFICNHILPRLADVENFLRQIEDKL